MGSDPPAQNLCAKKGRCAIIKADAAGPPNRQKDVDKIQTTANQKVKNIALAGLCTAFMAVVAPLSIPIGPVSLTLSVFGVFFAGAMLAPGWAAASILAYICIGAVGLPVFANMAAGVQVLTGMTAGFLWAYPLMAALLSAVCRVSSRLALRLAGVLAAQLICYALGTAWFMFVSGMGLEASLSVCVLPFILPDFLKGLGALALAGTIRRRLQL